MKNFLRMVAAVFGLAGANRLCEAGQVTMSDDQIQAVAREKVENRQTVGIVIGVLDDRGTRIFAAGQTSRENGKDVNADTLFEIGSITKTFTCALLADMVERGEVALDDPISKYTPPGITTPKQKGKVITLVDLATHSSGLPRMMSNFDPKDPENPYADYTLDKLWTYVSSCTLDRDIGESYEYSNVGMGLLGSLLARRAGTNFEGLMRERVLAPLDMNSTFLTIPASEKGRFATGHDTSLQPAHAWDFDAVAGCGAIRSSANDMMKYLAANMGVATNSLWPALDMAHQPIRSTTIPGTRIGLGWHVSERDGKRVVWHNGQTGGYHSCLAFDPTNRVGAFVLVNASVSIDEVAMQLIATNRASKPSAAATSKNVIQVGASKLTRLEGRYALSPGAEFNVRVDDGHLMAQLTGQPYFEIFPTSETNFFYKVVEARISFNCDGSGKVLSLTLHQNGADQEARKISDEAPKVRKEIMLSAETMDGYVGEYAVTPGATITIRRDGDRLLAKLTGQSFLQIYPESETNFFYKEVEAQISFVKGADGKTTGLALHQNGIDLRAEKNK